MNKVYWVLGIIGLIVAVAAPLAGNRLRPRGEHYCSLDGVRLVPLYQVRVVDAHGQVHNFCCVRCAEFWLSEQKVKPQAVFVTDESSGRLIDAAAACYVRSQVVTTPTTGNRVHVFQTRGDAENHAGQYGGRILVGRERPFQTAG
jgi:hypothetical protein